jgi:hypothetical protein
MGFRAGTGEKAGLKVNWGQSKISVELAAAINLDNRNFNLPQLISFPKSSAIENLW